jgi:DNA-binding SARP family transcriptional activator
MIEHSAVAVAPACLRLLGGWQLIVDGAEVELGHREQRLVALLGLTDLTGRGQVASMLWPDSTDEHALGSLRRAVRQCRTKSPDVLVADRLTVALDPGVRVDLDDLRRAAGLTRLPMTDAVARELLDALRGPELLPGWFDDRVVEERASLEHLRVEALERIAEHGLEQGDHALTVDAAGVASAIEPLRESARELAIRGHLGRGEVAHALHELQRYRVVMEDELGIEPSARIRALLEPSAAPPEREPEAVVSPSRPAPVDRPIPVPPPPMGIDEWLGQGRPSGVRRVLVALTGVAAVALAVALAMATTGPDPRLPATTDPGDLAGRVGPLERSSDPGAVAGPQQARTVRVRLVDSADGAAAFAVRATPLPAKVRLVVRGPAGLRVVRNVVVRAADGRQVVVDGLDAGTYQWSATSVAAGQVSGEVSVTPPPREQDVRDDAPSSATTVVPVVETPSQAPSPSPQPVTPSPSSTPSPTPTPSPTHTPSSTPHPSPTPSPTGTPKDPGTVAPTPVG